MPAPKSLTIALAQLNFTVGDIAGNVAKIRDARKQAKHADLIVFPELAVTGYPPEDLLLRQRFCETALEAVEQLAADTDDGGPAILLGGLWREEGELYNAAFLLDEGDILYIHRKHELPNYGVFDEKRLFAQGEMPDICEWRGMRLGILVCEDVWSEDVARHMGKRAPDILLVINASPYEMGKAGQRRVIAENRTRYFGVPMAYLNMVGGQDELVFDGRSFIKSSSGEDICRLEAFGEEVGISKWQKEKVGWRCIDAPIHKKQGDLETVYQALVLGLRDYVNKNGFKGVIIGLSGGMDSAFTAAVAVDALGRDRVRGLLMPSPYTSKDSVEDASALADTLGITMDTISITPAMEAYEALLSPVLGNLPKDTTEENIQARIRGNLLMAVSNKLGLMVLTTGNKSEMSVGYATLYGDMCGGYSVLKDMYKTTVYKVARWRNAHRSENLLGPDGAVIPERVFTKPPTAELKPNQTDQDTLPPYEVLDAILLEMIERQKSVQEITEKGYDRAVVEKVSRMITSAEYKRRQSPPGVKITGMSFGRDRRYPITNKYRT